MVAPASDPDSLSCQLVEHDVLLDQEQLTFLQRSEVSRGPIVVKYVVADQSHDEVVRFLERVQAAGLQEVIANLDVLDRTGETTVDTLTQLVAEGTDRGLSITLNGNTQHLHDEVHRKLRDSLHQRTGSLLQGIARRDRWWRHWMGHARRLWARAAFLLGRRPRGRLEIHSVVPRWGTVEGGQVVYVRGANLHQARSVRFGGRRVRFQLVDQGTARVRLPPQEPLEPTSAGSTFRPIDVRVAAPHKRSTLARGFTYC